MRLSIEVTPEQHRRLWAVAALRGRSGKEYVPERVLPDLAAAADEDEVLRRLKAFLEARIEAAQGAAVDDSVERIFEETHQETR